MLIMEYSVTGYITCTCTVYHLHGSHPNLEATKTCTIIKTIVHLYSVNGQLVVLVSIYITCITMDNKSDLLQYARDFSSQNVDLYTLLGVDATTPKEDIHRAW